MRAKVVVVVAARAFCVPANMTLLHLLIGVHFLTILATFVSVTETVPFGEIST